MFRQVVSYPKTDGGFRYRVVPSENRLELPDTGEDLPGWAQKQEWSWAGPEEIRLPSEESIEAPMLDVHVGEWPVDFDSRARRQKAKYARRMHVEKQLWVEANAFEPLGLTGKNEASGRMENRRRAERVGETVDPAAHCGGPEGLGAILESGKIQVRGTVYFRPLRPFDPAPEIPEMDAQGNLVGDAQNRLYASESIGGEQGYQYSRDAQSGSRRGGGSR